MISRFKTSLTSSLASGGSESTLTIDSVTTTDGQTIVIGDFPSGKIRLTINPGGATAEDVYGTGITSTTITGLVRGLSERGDDTALTANKKVHYPGETIIISNPGNFLKNDFVTLGGDQTGIAGDKTFTGDTNFTGDVTIDGGDVILNDGTVTLDADNVPIFDAQPTISDNKEVATKKYADDIALAGAPDAGLTTKGVIEQATIAEISANAAAGSGTTTAPLAITTDNTSNTSSAKQIIPVTDADGDIPIGFMQLDANWAFTGTTNSFAGTNFDITATNWKRSGSAINATAATLNEMHTFFGSTDISAAEAETLTDGSDAATLHTHSNVDKILDINLTPATQDNSASEFTIYTYTVPANTLGTTKGIRVRLWMSYFNDDGGAGNTTFKLKYGTTTIATIAKDFGNSQLGYIEAHIFANAATDAQIGHINLQAVGQTGITEIGGISFGTATEDSTGALAVTITFTGLNGNSDVSRHSAYTELLGV